MYKIIGTDGREYGPISADQLRQWIREGRANAQTSVQTEGSNEWKPLGTVPEFADVTQPPAAPPPVGATNAEQLTAEMLQRDYTVRIGDCIGRGWELVKTDLAMFIGATLLTMIICGASIIGLILGGPMLGGLYALLLKRLRNQPGTFGDVFAGFNVAFLPLMLGHIVSQLLTGIGLVLCIIPGIYLAVSWMFTMPLIMDKRLDFWAAMELSRKMVAKHWWGLFGLLLVSGLVGLAGVLLCGIGLIITMPIMFGALACAYEGIFADRPAPTA